MNIRFHPGAETEFHEARIWYGQRLKGLDDEFVLALKKLWNAQEEIQRCIR